MYIKRKKPRTPLQLNILAVFPPWGGFQGAGRVTGAKVQRLFKSQNFFKIFFKKNKKQNIHRIFASK